MKTKSKRSLALFLVSALLAGGLPLSGSASVQAASHNLNNPTTDADGVTTWNCIWFGNYWQEDTNGDGEADKNDAKTPIKWRVLSVDGDDAFLLADKNLDGERYNDTFTDITWETCTMRSWLNGYGAEANKDGKDYSNNNFLNNAFSQSEQTAVRTTNVVNDDNPYYGTEGGSDTLDKIYLLSIGEAANPSYGFLSDDREEDKGREAKNTVYTKKIPGVFTDVSEEYAGNGVWWLRSPGNISSHASLVRRSGYVDRSGGSTHDNIIPIRPALHLNLSSTSSWSYAGTVTSEGKVDETGGTTPTEPGSTQKPQETVEPGETEKPSVTLPASGTSSQPGTSSVRPSVPQPGSSVAPSSGISSDPEKGTIEKVSALKLKQKKNTVTASWKKLSRAKGYQICYSTSKKWKGKKQKLVTKNNAVIKNLKKQKTYYFRVRAYRLEGAKKVYGAWSATKRITIKK